MTVELRQQKRPALFVSVACQSLEARLVQPLGMRTLS
jgi:hypothetical protein